MRRSPQWPQEFGLFGNADGGIVGRGQGEADGRAAGVQCVLGSAQDDGHVDHFAAADLDRYAVGVIVDRIEQEYRAAIAAR